MVYTFICGKKLSKDHPKLEVLGTLDELLSFLGLVASFSQEKRIKKEVVSIQGKIFEMGEALVKKTFFAKRNIKLLETKIDFYQEKLPKVEKFILPGGTRQAAALHVCRAITRRAERRLVSLAKKEKIDSVFLNYLNRLSFFLYLLARLANFEKGKKEVSWPF